MRAFSTIITFHGEENKPKNGISVANHTSPIDVMVGFKGHFRENWGLKDFFRFFQQIIVMQW